MDYLVVPQQGSKISLPTIPLPSEPSFLHPALKGYAAAGAHTGFMTHADAHHVVPQMIQPSAAQPPAGTTRLTAAQAAELEMARRRAQKAAEGKRANATAARRAKRRAAEQADGSRQVPDLSAAQREREEREREEEEDEEMDGNDDLEARLANAKDEKETKRLKRLLRNRVSAQQARERKKSYVNGLEARVKAAEQKVAQAEQRVKTLERENGVLRNVIKNMQVEKLMGAFTQQKDLDALAGSGLYVGGVKYLVIPGDFGAVIRGKKGPEGITIKKTITALVLGSYGEGVQPADGNVVVEALGDYLIGQGI